MHNADIEVINAAEFSSTSALLKDEYNALNETILAAILADGHDSRLLTDMERAAIKPFDMVVVNLCPFEKLALESNDTDEVISKIDIAGITLLRAAAKNYKNVTVIADKIDYYVALNANEFGRLKLATKAFYITSNYDRAVSQLLAEQSGDKPFKTFSLEKLRDLQYGENPHQSSSRPKSHRRQK